MHISTENGETMTDRFEEIVDIIDSSSEVWISGEDNYPCLSLLINDDKVCVNYFGVEKDDLWMSRSDTLQTVTFLISGEEWEAPEDSVISMGKALECVKEFCRTLSRPSCIDWQIGV